MTRSRRWRRASPLGRCWLAVLVCACALLAEPAGAQVRPDTVVSDTLPEARPAARDTTPADTIGPAPALPDYPEPLPVGWAAARWEWDRDELLRFQGLSLLELLERVPGVVITRGGGFGHPAGLTALGQAGGRLRVFRDGFELDPLGSASLDLQQVGLVDLQTVRVERTPGEVRVYLETFRLPDARSFSEVEIGTGNYQAKFLRALLSRVVGTHSTVTGAYDLSTASGFRFDEPFSFHGGRLRWTYVPRERTGVQLEYRRIGVERASELYPLHATRREVVLRGRAAPIPGLTLDAQLGRATHAPSAADSAGGADATIDTLDVHLASTQAALRAGYVRDPGFVEAGARVRVGDERGYNAPGGELWLRAGARPLRWLGLEAQARSARVEEGQAAEYLVGARTGPVLGLSLFGALTGGDRWLATRRDTVFQRVDSATVRTAAGQDSVTVDTVDVRRASFPSEAVPVGGARVGVEWSGLGATLGAAALRAAPTRVGPFAVGFDRGVPLSEAGEARGFEVFGSLPLPVVRGVHLEGWYTRWLETGGRPYLPEQQARLSLVYHRVLVEGQFEPLLRIDAQHRGRTLVPDERRTGFSATTEPYTLLNLFLQLRIVDLRAFFIYENLTNALEAQDVPERFLPGPRTLYGVRWFFRN